MKFTIWGARGSHPKPLTPQDIRSKISAVVQRIQPKDIQSTQNREAFMARLPTWLFGTYSGNTSCIEVQSCSGATILFDCGTGLVEYWKNQLNKGAPLTGNEFHIFFTHYHYDHIQGFPFFVPAYIAGNSVSMYSPHPNLEDVLRNQMRHPYFPVTIEDKMSAELSFRQLPPRGTFPLNDIELQWLPLEHPGGSYGYSVRCDDVQLLYCTDVDLNESFYRDTQENNSFFKNADVMIIDTQYTLDEALKKFDWGHTSYIHAVDFAIHWNIKKIIMFHHEPAYSDQKIFSNRQAAEDYARNRGNKTLEIQIAQEGMSIEV